MSRCLVHPLAPLVILSMMTGLLLAAHVAVRINLSPITEFLMSFGWFLMLVLWMDADARSRRRVPCYDFGMLAVLTFPLSVIWYCFWSRRWRGILFLLLLGGLFYAPNIGAIILHELVRLGR
jgi:hypothetical protein